MKPINFKEQNIVYAKNQKEYQPLPAFKSDGQQGEVISCWKLSIIERLRILFIGKLWVCLLSFNKPLTPSFFTTRKSEVLNSKVRIIKNKEDIKFVGKKGKEPWYH